MTPGQTAPANVMTDGENGSPGPDENPFNRAMEDWRSRTPLLCRLLAQTICLSYILSWLVDLSPLFACVPSQTLYKFELYRLVLSPLVGNSLLSALFASITIGDGVGPRLERSVGTASFSALVLMAVICINVSFVLLCFGAAAGGSLEPLEFVSSGVWGPLLCLVAVESLSAPEATRRLLFLPIEIPRLYYPLALSGLFMLLSGLQLDLCLGVALGYAEHYGYLEPLRPSTAMVSRLETQSWLASVVCYPGYITGRAALGSAAWVQLTQDAAWATNERQQPGLSSLFEAFRRRSRNEPTPSSRPQFPETSGRVLGVSATPAASNVGSSVRRFHPVSALHMSFLGLALGENSGCQPSYNSRRCREAHGWRCRQQRLKSLLGLSGFCAAALVCATTAIALSGSQCAAVDRVTNAERIERKKLPRPCARTKRAWLC